MYELIEYGNPEYLHYSFSKCLEAGSRLLFNLPVSIEMGKTTEDPKGQ